VKNEGYKGSDSKVQGSDSGYKDYGVQGGFRQNIGTYLHDYMVSSSQKTVILKVDFICA
jgi:hypothetical protein